MNAKNTVFVNLPNPNAIPTPETRLRQWKSAAVGFAKDLTPAMNPEPETPTIAQLFEKALPYHIEGSRWGRYIAPGPASRVSNGTIFQYHGPCKNFWDLYELSKGIFRDLGIRLSKSDDVWVAHIPIRILTNTVFVDSGLAAVERTLLAHTGIDPAKILREIRKRQFQETQDAIRRGGTA